MNQFFKLMSATALFSLTFSVPLNSVQKTQKNAKMEIEIDKSRQLKLRLQDTSQEVGPDDHLRESYFNFALSNSKDLVAIGARLHRIGSKRSESMESFLGRRSCLFVLYDNKKHPRGSVSFCHDGGPHAIIYDGEHILELLPTGKNATSFSTAWQDDLSQDNTTILPWMEDFNVQELTKMVPKRITYEHILRKHTLPVNRNCDCVDRMDCEFNPKDYDPLEIPELHEVMIDPDEVNIVKRAAPPVIDGLPSLLPGDPHFSTPLKVELGVFLDEALLASFNEYLATEDDVINLVLGLINNAQALFHHPSLGRQVDLQVTHLFLLKTQPKDLPLHGGNRVSLLKSFCGYNQRKNNADDNNPGHWDLGIYVSGINFVSDGGVSGEMNGVTMGLAYTGGICNPEQSCVITELGVTNFRGRPYPSAGALASYILAHEIGHSLGLRHDGVSNGCPSIGYIMAAGRSLKGATTWSTCSKKKIWEQSGSCLSDEYKSSEMIPDKGYLSRLNHSVYEELPGQTWDALAQCQLFLRDEDTTLSEHNLENVCESIQCITPHRLASYLAGPALEGTYCGGRKWCRGGMCTPWDELDSPVVQDGGYGPWRHTGCVSACIQDGTGWQVSSRRCDSPPPKNSVKGCLSEQRMVSFCDDEQICSGAQRIHIDDLASSMCSLVATHKEDVNSVGVQLPHNPDEPWQACTLYCEMKNSSEFWTPRFEFQDQPEVPAHFPAGTLCHIEGHNKFRCIHKICTPQNKTMDMIARQTNSEWRLPISSNLIHPQDYADIDIDDLFF